jgi:hypothetical protein
MIAWKHAFRVMRKERLPKRISSYQALRYTFKKLQGSINYFLTY